MTGIRKRIQERRERNHRLAVADAALRCAFCKRALPKDGTVSRWPDPETFCDAECMADDDERKALVR